MTLQHTNNPTVPNKHRSPEGGQSEPQQGSTFVKKMWKYVKITDQTSLTWNFLSPMKNKSGSWKFWIVLS